MQAGPGTVSHLQQRTHKAQLLAIHCLDLTASRLPRPPLPLPLQSTCNVANCKQCTIRTNKCNECKARYWLNSFNNRCVRWL